MYELGADGNSGGSAPKKPSSRRCFSFDVAMQKSRKTLKKSSLSPMKMESFEPSSEAPIDLLEEKSKLAQQISSAIGGIGEKSSKPDKWLDEALSLHMGRESRIRSSLSCEHIPLSSSMFSPVNLFSDRSLNDRKLQNPFGDDLYMPNNYMREPPVLFENTMKSACPGFPSLPNIDSMTFFKEFSSWDADCE